MAPLKQSTPSTLPSPPSSPQPPQGVIRLLQHNKEHPLSKTSGKLEGLPLGPRILSKGSSPLSQHASLEGRISLDSDREQASARATTVQYRSGPMRRDHSGSRTGRDGGISVINRLDTTQAVERMPKSMHEQPQHHRPGQTKVQLEQHLSRDLPRGPSNTQGHSGTGRFVCSSFHREERRFEGDQTRAGPSNHSGKLFDPRKDDPVRFASMKTKYGLFPSSAPPGAFSASTNSVGSYSISSKSDARSIVSASSTNASSAGKEKRRRRGPSSRTTIDSTEPKRADADVDRNSYVIELKRWYREIALVEQKLQEEHKSAHEKQRKDQSEVSHATHKRSQVQNPGIDTKGELDHTYWVSLINRHRYLAETHAAFMEAALKPGLPTSLHSLPQKYNIPTRLWQTGFHSLLERLRHLLPTSTSDPTAVLTTSKELEAAKQLQRDVLDLLVEFIYFAYTFYTNLLESETFRSFRSTWIENLGDLARYRMAVAKIMTRDESTRNVSRDYVQAKEAESRLDKLENKAEEEHESHDGSNVEKSSIGFTALNGWDTEEKEVWKSTAKEWYAKGLAEVPGTGRLHHHLGILSRDEELRSLHHLCKSLTCSHPYPSARESVLPLFERDVQQRRLGSNASLVDLFVHLHGILFTKVQLDDFDAILLRFIEKLKVIDDREFSPATWMMMGAINIASLSRYTSPNVKSNTIEDLANKKDKEVITMQMEANSGRESKEDDDDNEEEGERSDGVTIEAAISSDQDNVPYACQYASRFTLAVLSILASKLIQDHSPMPRVNPYITMLLTFLSQECKQSAFLKCVERYIPWHDLIELMSHLPPSLESIDPRKDLPARIRRDNGPLAEDWSLRGMAWVGRKVFERGFWKTMTQKEEDGTLIQYGSEVDMLDKFSHVRLRPIECSRDSSSLADNHSDADEDRITMSLTTLRWKRIAYTLTMLIQIVPGLDYEATDSAPRFRLTTPLKEKTEEWKTFDDISAQQKRLKTVHIEAKRGPMKARGKGGDLFDSKEEDDASMKSSSDEEDRTDETEIVRLLRARQKKLRQELRESKDALARPLVPANVKTGLMMDVDDNAHRKRLSILPGYTILVLDTNVMLTPSNVLEMLVDSGQWCVIVPLVVVTELDGITKRPGSIGQRAQHALAHLEKRIKINSNLVKVQTSRGNYLGDLQFRTEEIDFAALPKRVNQNELGNNNNKDNKAKRDGSQSPKKKAIRTDDLEEEELNPNHHRSIRSIDEVILYCLDWQTSHFMDRSAFICKDKDDLQKVQDQITNDTIKAVLVTLDKNLRLKAKCHNLIAIGPNELVNLLDQV